MINVLDLFSGIGGFTLASSWVGGYRTVGFCEIEGFCRDLLKQNFPGIPIFEDVKELHPEDVIRQREPVHLITAGFPCQDISQAGVQKGIKAERSGLFFEILRLSDEFYAYSGVRPALLLENVANILSGGKGEWARIVHGEVASRGYDCEWKIVSAASVGAPHLRKRWWCIAYVVNSGHSPDRTKRGQEGEEESLQVINRQEGLSGVSGRTGSNSEVLAYSNDKRLEGHNDRESTSLKTEPLRTDFGAKDKCEWGDKRESVPGLGGVVNGPPNWIHEPDIPRVTTEKKNRVKRLKSLGNSIVPQCAMIPLIRFREIYEEQNKI
tara:strand:- start:1604 stop:2572 length:969 start_codon:yes stop_codon:yes gene_type:complete